MIVDHLILYKFLLTFGKSVEGANKTHRDGALGGKSMPGEAEEDNGLPKTRCTALLI